MLGLPLADMAENPLKHNTVPALDKGDLTAGSHRGKATINNSADKRLHGISEPDITNRDPSCVAARVRDLSTLLLILHHETATHLIDVCHIDVGKTRSGAYPAPGPPSDKDILPLAVVHFAAIDHIVILLTSHGYKPGNA